MWIGVLWAGLRVAMWTMLNASEIRAADRQPHSDRIKANMLYVSNGLRPGKFSQGGPPPLAIRLPIKARGDEKERERERERKRKRERERYSMQRAPPLTRTKGISPLRRLGGTTHSTTRGPRRPRDQPPGPRGRRAPARAPAATTTFSDGSSRAS